MAWVEKANMAGGYRTVWEPPAGSGLPKRQSLSWPNAETAYAAKRFVEEHRNNISREEVYRVLVGDELPAADRRRKSSCMTFREFAEKWLRENPKLTTGTRNNYRSQLERVWFPLFGEKAITEVDDEDIQKGINLLRERRIKHQTITRYFSVVHSIFNRAVRTKSLGMAVNPAVYLNWDRSLTEVEQDAHTPDDKYLEVWEYELVLQHVHPDSRLLVQFLAETGARIGEATAVQVGDFDPDEKTITIRRAWKHDGLRGKFELGVPKGRSSRVVVLTDYMTDRFTALTTSRAADEFIFTSRNGKPVNYANFSTRRWRTAVQAAQSCIRHPAAQWRVGSTCTCSGVLRKDPGIHSLRHSYTTWMLTAGRAREDVADDLGHASLQMIEKTYKHIARKRDRSGARRMDEIMGRAAPRREDDEDGGLTVAV